MYRRLLPHSSVQNRLSVTLGNCTMAMTAAVLGTDPSKVTPSLFTLCSAQVVTVSFLLRFYSYLWKIPFVRGSLLQTRSRTPVGKDLPSLSFLATPSVPFAPLCLCIASASSVGSVRKIHSASDPLFSAGASYGGPRPDCEHSSPFSGSPAALPRPPPSAARVGQCESVLWLVLLSYIIQGLLQDPK